MIRLEISVYVFCHIWKNLSTILYNNDVYFICSFCYLKIIVTESKYFDIIKMKWEQFY